MKRGSRSRSFVVAVLLTAGFAACTDRSPTRPTLSASNASSGGVSVTSAAPDSAPQDTTLDVHVFGSGFDHGSNAQWAQNGTVSPNVKTNSTKFVSSGELVANITIALTATAGSYDIVVTTSQGKKGIGTELFTIDPRGKPSPPPANPAIAFTAGSNSNLWVMNADGSNQTQITSSLGTQASWAPFGNGTPANPYAIAVSGPSSTCQVYRIDVAVVNGVPQGSNPLPLSVPTGVCAQYPAWSPLGDVVAFDGNAQLWLTPAGGTGQAVAVYADPGAQLIAWPAWRNDATQIAFVELDASNNWSIKVLKLGTSTVTTVLGPQSGRPRFLDWARTKDVLAFSAGANGDSLYTLDLTSGTLTQIVPGGYPTWSPDDTELAFCCTQVVVLATKAVTKLGKNGGSLPDWRR